MILISCSVAFLSNAQTSKKSAPKINQEQFERIMQDAAFEKSWDFVKQKMNYPKSIKFSDVYDYGDGLGDSSYCILGHFTLKGKYNETIGRYYYCYLKIIDFKKQIWELQKMEISPFPFKNGD
jgi:hypothetical protein